MKNIEQENRTKRKYQFSPIQQKSRSRSRSRQKPTPNNPQRPQAYMRKMNIYQKPPQQSLPKQTQSKQGEIESEQEQQKKNIKKQLLRSFLRIQQLRQEPIDKFVKIVWILKGKLMYDPRIHDIMADPKRYLEKLEVEELRKMVGIAEGHRMYQHYEGSKEEEYWVNLIGLIKYLVEKASESEQKLQPQYEQRIKQIIMKPLAQLIKLQKQTLMILKNQVFGSNNNYWKQVLIRIKAKRTQLMLQKFYQKYKQQNTEQICEITQQVPEPTHEPTSPTLVPFSSINPKLIIEQQHQKQSLKALSQKIFKLEYERGRERLQINLSLPHNHNLLNTEIVTEHTTTYDQITKEIIEFEKYKRMEEDQEDFNDWVPCQTQGRFRDMKPVYINRVRVACQWNKYNSMHYNQDNPPPKTIQGYKFNIFYPDLQDKQKTPQYYLQDTDDPNYCIIKFKAGPPYKDIAFKILKKQWDFTEKSGFESIFSRGIVHLYFNFKKPRFRI